MVIIQWTYNLLYMILNNFTIGLIESRQILIHVSVFNLVLYVVLSLMMKIIYFHKLT